MSGHSNARLAQQVCLRVVSLGGVPREQKMLKGHLPRVIYHQVYEYTKINPSEAASEGPRPAELRPAPNAASSGSLAHGAWSHFAHGTWSHCCEGRCAERDPPALRAGSKCLFQLRSFEPHAAGFRRAPEQSKDLTKTIRPCSDDWYTQGSSNPIQNSILDFFVDLWRYIPTNGSKNEVAIPLDGP